MNSEKALKIFEKLCSIPHGSGNEEAISKYIYDFAKERGLWAYRDSANNVYIKKPASKGYENAPSVLIQGHMDMVCEKEEGVEHNFLTDPLKLVYDGDWLKAEGTTLGGDDGVAVAYALALIDSEDIAHPALEVVITTDEEVGMDGAAALEADVINSRIMLNLDIEEEGRFNVGCAGGLKHTTHIPVKLIDNSKPHCFKIKVSGLLGGHSGEMIDLERANANVLMGRVLNHLGGDVLLADICGGSKDNAIPRIAEAVVCCEKTEELIDGVKWAEEVIRAEYSFTDPDISVSAEEFDKPEKCFDELSTDRVVSALVLLPNGVQYDNKQLNMVETSNNIGVVRTANDEVTLTCALRSSVGSRKRLMHHQIERLAKLFGGYTTERGEYPAWEYKAESPIREKCVKVFEQMFGKAPIVETVHAGLECGIILDKIPDMDCISFGPDIKDIHTPQERLSVSSFERMWNYLVELLKTLK